jgi:hypothetical protein
MSFDEKENGEILRTLVHSQWGITALHKNTKDTQQSTFSFFYKDFPVKNCVNLEGQGLYIRNTHTPEFSRFLAVSFDKGSSYEYLAERGEQEELAKYTYKIRTRLQGHLYFIFL